MTYFANRGDDMEMRDLKISYDLGRTRFVFYEPRDRDSIKNVIADADVVINLIGKHHETGQPIQKPGFPYIGWKTNYSYRDANVLIPRTLAEICLEMQVDNFIHVSSASASPTAKSEWSRTKYEGEQAIKAVYPWATIIRPTQIFGQKDRMLNWFAEMSWRHRFVPLVDGGKALTQPVWVGDVANTILRCADEAEKFAGRQIDCFGPAEYTYKELAEFVQEITERSPNMYNMPKPLVKAISHLMQWRRNPLLHPDWVEVMSEDFLPSLAPEAYAAQENDATRILTMADLGVPALPIEKEAFNYLHTFRFGGHFHRVSGYHSGV
jgi:NADH dehydrogenase (ubiquinone) 1 alpha subcomplex subunit 9